LRDITHRSVVFNLVRVVESAERMLSAGSVAERTHFEHPINASLINVMLPAVKTGAKAADGGLSVRLT
jgi:hypothetical protein